MAALIFPILITALLLRYFPRLQDPVVSDRIGSLYSGLNERSKGALAYNVLFVSRRLIFAFIIVRLFYYPCQQVQVMMLSSIMMIIYTVSVRPFEEPLLNRVEIFNELCILVSSYHLIVFTDFMPSGNEGIQEKAGYTMIGVTLLNVLINTLIMIA